MIEAVVWKSERYRISVKILYEDNHLLVVEKPVNIPSQEDETGDPDMLTILKEYIKQKYNKPGEVFLGLVHRLDRPVGGAMVFARTSKAASRLSTQIREGTFDKVYTAIVHGTVRSNTDHLEHYLLKDERTNTVKAVNGNMPGAKKAVLEYTVIGKEGEYSLVRIKLFTGRSHQIRVQFSTIGHPLYGDQKYGADVNKPGQQIALWSTEIALEHPTKKESMTFSCPLPQSMPWSWFGNIK